MSCFRLEHARDREDSLKKQGDESAHDVRANSPESLPPAHDQSGEASEGLASPTKPGSFARFPESGGSAIYLCGSGDQGLPFIASQRRQYNDSDLETEAEMPPTDNIIAKDILRKLKPKERKRQDVINELFYTERAHVRNLKVMQQLFYQPMMEDPIIASPDFVTLLFPNIDEMVKVHGALNNDFKQRRKDSPQAVVDKVGDILVKRFTGEEGKAFMEACATFCERQSQALEALRARQLRSHKDPKHFQFAQFLEARLQDPLCRRLQLKDFLPTAMQRLTKYPMLIEKLLCYTPSDLDEYGFLQDALTASKNILSCVNYAVQECENSLKLADLQRRLDKKSVESVNSEFKEQHFDLTRHRLLLDGQLTWRLTKAREIDILAVLLDEFIVLLQRQDEKLILRSQGKEDRTTATHSPIIPLSTMLTRSVANDKRALYVISTPPGRGPQIYELVASSKDERNKWLKYITEAAEKYKDNNPLKTPPRMPKRYHAHPLSSDSVSLTDSAPADTVSSSMEGDSVSTSDKVYSEPDEMAAISNQHAHSESIKPMSSIENATSSSPVGASGSDTVHGCFEKLQQTNELIHQLMNDKRRMLADLMHVNDEDFETVAELNVEMSGDKDASELVFASLTLADRLIQIANERLTVGENVPADSSNESNQDVLTSGSLSEMSAASAASPKGAKFPLAQLISISDRLHQNLTTLLKIVVCGDNPHHLLVHQAVDEHAEESKVVEHAQEEKLEFPSDSGSRVEEADELKADASDTPTAGATEVSTPEDGIGANDDDTKPSVVSETVETAGDINKDDSEENREETEAQITADDSIHLTFPDDTGRSSDGADNNDGIL